MTQRIRRLVIAVTALCRPFCSRVPRSPARHSSVSHSTLAPPAPSRWGTATGTITDPTYDVSHLVPDTLALLMPVTPVMVRMETLRRATLYAAAHPRLAAALLAELQTRAAAPQPPGAALAMFDFGYLVESYKEASLFAEPLPAIDRIDGYQLVLKAHALHNNATMQQAARLIADGHPRATR